MELVLNALTPFASLSSLTRPLCRLQRPSIVLRTRVSRPTEARIQGPGNLDLTLNPCTARYIKAAIIRRSGALVVVVFVLVDSSLDCNTRIHYQTLVCTLWLRLAGGIRLKCTARTRTRGSIRVGNFPVMPVMRKGGGGWSWRWWIAEDFHTWNGIVLDKLELLYDIRGKFSIFGHFRKPVSRRPEGCNVIVFKPIGPQPSLAAHTCHCPDGWLCRGEEVRTASGECLVFNVLDLVTSRISSLGLHEQQCCGVPIVIEVFHHEIDAAKVVIVIRWWPLRSDGPVVITEDELFEDVLPEPGCGPLWLLLDIVPEFPHLRGID